MGHTIVSFQDKYFEYGCHPDPEERGLAIGAYDAAFMADITAAFAFEMAESYFGDAIFHKIYRDDGLVVFSGLPSISELENWFRVFRSTWTAPSMMKACVSQ